MMKLAGRFLSMEEKGRIIRCVKEAEKSTSGEIVPLVVSSSYHYPMAPVLGALVTALVLATAANVALSLQTVWGTRGVWHLWVFPGVLALVFVIAHEVIRRVPALRRLFIRPEEMDEEVEEEALGTFYRRGLDRTRDKTGVLIFVSVFERRVRVLADSGINSRVDPRVWSEVVEMIVAGIHEKRQADALCRAVQRCGELLRDHFPGRRDDVDELENLVIEE